MTSQMREGVGWGLEVGASPCGGGGREKAWERWRGQKRMEIRERGLFHDIRQEGREK